MSDISSTTSSTPTGMTGAGGGQMIRITGMASGLDVDAIVKKMLVAEQNKIDKAKQDQQAIQWRQEAYQDIIKDIKDLQNTYFNSLDSANNILSSSNYAGFDANVADTTMAAITAGVGVQTGTYKIDFSNIPELATSAFVTGSNSMSSSSGDVSLSSTMEELGLSSNSDTFDITYNGTTKTVTVNKTDTLSDVINNISTVTSGEVKASYSELTGKLTIETTSTGSEQIINISNGSGAGSALTALKIDNNSSSQGKDYLKGNLATTASTASTSNVVSSNGDAGLSSTMEELGLSSASDTFDIIYNGTKKTVTVNKTDKLSDVINNISTVTSGAVKASFSQLTGKFTMETTNTGSGQSIKILNGSGVGSALTALKIDDGSNGQGKDAVVKITPPGGNSVTVTKSTNNFTIDGITYNLQSATGEDNEESTTFSITQNTQKVYDKISGFLDKYNDIVDKIQTKLTEKKNYDYTPLTDAQRSSMSASQITAWEDKAKQGLLKNDKNLQSLLSSMRSAFVTGVTDAGLTFGKYGTNSIGIDTSDDITQGGKITIVDQQKLKNAIAQHGDQILKLFTNVSSNTDKTAQFNENGIFKRLSNIFVDNVGYVGTTLNSAILTKYANYQDDYSIYGSSGNNTLPDQIYRQTQLIKKLNNDFSDKQEKYYKQFSVLETALTQMSAQQSMLSQYGM